MNYICSDYNDSKKPCLFYVKTGFCSRKDRFGCLEYIRRKNPIMSYSSLSSYLRCRRHYYLSRILGIELIEPQLEMKEGIILHLNLASLHTTNNDKDTYLKQSTIEQNKLLNNIIEEDMLGRIAIAIIKINAVTEGYKQVKKDSIEKGIVEVSDSIINDDIFLKAKYDLRLEKEDSIMDYKYTKNPDYYTFFTTMLQAGIYLMVSKTKSITYRLIQKPQLKLGKEETGIDYKKRIIKDITNRPKHYIQDITFYRSEYDFNYIMNYIKNITNEIKSYIEKGEETLQDCFFQEYNCWQYNKWCEFLQVCESRVISETLYRYKQIKGEYDNESND